MSSRVAFGLFALVASAQICSAADPRYPDWPCAQAKVPEISLAAVWAGPSLDDADQKWKSDPKISALVEKVAARKLPRKQRQAADKVRSDTIELQALQDATPRDQGKIDELGNTLVWETRIFEDRRRVVKFVCEVPTTIDQRLFALGRTIQQEIE
jgi:hypothetical protein